MPTCPPTGVCAQDPLYRTSTDFDYWVPLEFDAQGKVKQFAEFIDEFDLMVESQARYEGAGPFEVVQAVGAKAEEAED